MRTEIIDKVRQTLGDKKISVSQFEKWKDHFMSQAYFIEDQRQKFENLEKEFYENEHITQLTFADEIPEEMTAAKYLLMYKKIWATIRHDMWKALEEKKKEERVTRLKKDQII